MRLCQEIDYQQIIPVIGFQPLYVSTFVCVPDASEITAPYVTPWPVLFHVDLIFGLLSWLWHPESESAHQEKVPLPSVPDQTHTVPAEH